MAIYNDVKITIDLNELVECRAKFLKQNMSPNQIDYLAETLRRTLTWDNLYFMVDESILEFFDNHEHPEIWDPHYGETAGNEPAATFEKNRQQFKMVKLESPSWTIEVPVRKKK